VVTWYLDLYHGTASDPGLLAMFCDPTKVGAFAVTVSEIRRGDGDALFRMLVAATMFQRLRDVQIFNVLRDISKTDARELGGPKRLLALVDSSPCPHTKSTEGLRKGCDLSKHPVSRKGRCHANPRIDCHLKRHTVVLRRYGHFGKVPTSAALMVREAGVSSLEEMRSMVFKITTDPEERSRLLEEHLSRAWRLSDKIASMFLSALAAPDLVAGVPPWQAGLDWTRFVVVDSNVDLFLAAIGYSGNGTYAARREFIRRLARRIDLSKMRRGMVAFNPRLVQQAMYIFMSLSNRRTVATDCMHQGQTACAACPKSIAALCPARSAS
jgi:hypothetical protein